MKKLTSLLLAFALLLTLAVPAFAEEPPADEPTPIIYLRGNGEPIYDAEGNEVFADVGDLKLGDTGKEKIVEAAVNILRPFLFEGLLFNKWDRYGQAVYDEISPLFEKASLDGNGDPKYGTGVSPAVLAQSEKQAQTDQIRNGKYGYFSYMFHFDWRLDPYAHVDRLHEYIKTVLQATGKQQVSLTSRCLGGSVMNAYLEKYGSEGLVKNALYCETLGNGCTMISKGFSGQIDFDPAGIQRYYGQAAFCKEIGFGIGIDVPELADEIVQRTLDLMVQDGRMDRFCNRMDALAARLYKALIPALFLAVGYGTQPIYWTFVAEEDFDRALDVMFGEEGGEKRAQYAGLIEKIQSYRAHVTSQRTALYQRFRDEYGIHMGVIAKYGLLNMPIFAGSDELSDSLASLKDSSLGATCAKVGETLPQTYIDARIATGYGDYISADRQVDLSTAMYPETTWVIKNVHHDDFDRACWPLAELFLNGTGVTVENSGCARFRINDYAAKTVEPMTEDHCEDLEFMTRPVAEPTFQTRLQAFVDWVKAFFALIGGVLRGEVKL
ncbi:MAG: hypothetical protein IKN72_01910 [Clostridia bacterium]|nr:hypothetical protein [Clostridia bacterium]